jgi:hypothetical protein
VQQITITAPAETPHTVAEIVLSSALPQKVPCLRISLCNLCVLCVSVVTLSQQKLTTEAQRTQRLHREEARIPTFRAKPLNSGIARVTVSERRVLEANGDASVNDCVELDVSTPAAKAFLDRLTSQPCFTRSEYAVAVRQPRALISREAGFRKRLNWIRRTISHRRPLLAYGLVESKLLFMIAGLLFIPLSPLMLSIGFGLWTKQWRLARQA